MRLDTKAELDDIMTRIRNSGFYPAIVSQDELTHLSENEAAVGPAVQHGDDQLA